MLIYKENAYEVLNSNIHYFNPEKFEIEKLKWQESKTDGFIDFGSVLLELDKELSRKEFLNLRCGMCSGNSFYLVIGDQLITEIMDFNK